MSLLANLMEGSMLCRPFLALVNSPRTNTEEANPVPRSSSLIGATFSQFMSIASQPSRLLGAQWSKGATVIDGVTWSLFLAWIAWSTVMSTSQIALGMVLVCSLVLLRWGLWGQGKKPYEWSRLDTLVLVFFATAVIAAAFSSLPVSSFKGLAKFLIFFAGYITTRWLLFQNPARRLWILIWFVAMGVAQSVIGFYQYTNEVAPLATWVDPKNDPTMSMTRVWGTIQPLNPNLLAGYLAPLLGLAAGLGLEGLLKRQWVASALAWACALFILVGACLNRLSRRVY